MARGSLRIERFQSLAKVGTAVGGVASELSAQGASLDATSRQLGKVADQAAAREGAEAGALAATEGRPVLRKSGSIYGEAYDQAAMRMYADQLDTRMLQDASAAYDANRDDPAKLKTALDDVGQRMMSEDVLDDPVAQRTFALKFARTRLAYERDAARRADDRARNQGAADASSALTASLNEVQRQGFAFGLDEGGLKVTEASAASAKDVVDRAVASGAVTPHSAAAAKARIDAGRLTAHIEGAFDQIPDAAGRAAFIDKLNADYKAGNGLAGKLSLDDFQTLTTKFDRVVRAGEVRANASATELKRRADLVRKTAEDGYDIAESEWNALGTLAGKVDGGDRVVSGLRAEATEMGRWRTMPLVQLEAAVTGEREKLAKAGADPGQAARVERADKLLSTMRTELAEDPLGWAGRNKVADVPPLVLDGSDAAAASLTKRASVAEAVAEHYGVAPKYFMPQERAALIQSMRADDTVAVRLGAMLERSMGPAAARRALAEIGAKDKDGALVAFAGGLGISDPLVADGILKGRRAMEAEPRLVPKSGAEGDAFGAALSAAMPVSAFSPAALTGETRAYAVMSDAVRSRYAQLAAIEGDVSGKTNERRLRRAVDEVTGGVLTHNGRPLIAPKRGMSQAEFDGVLWGLTDADMTGVTTLSGAPITAQYVRQAATLESRGDGTYRVRLGQDGAAPIYAVRAGNPFILDLRGRRVAPVPAWNAPSPDWRPEPGQPGGGLGTGWDRR